MSVVVTLNLLFLKRGQMNVYYLLTAFIAERCMSKVIPTPTVHDGLVCGVAPISPC